MSGLLGITGYSSFLSASNLGGSASGLYPSVASPLLDALSVSTDLTQPSSSLRQSSISVGSVINSTLEGTAPVNPTRSVSVYEDYFLADVVAGQQVQVNLNAEFDTYLQLVNAETGQLLAENDDYNGLNSQLRFTAEAGIQYAVRATSYSSADQGDYTLSANLWNGMSGTLEDTDPLNPTRAGCFSDDYLLTGVVAGQQVQVNLEAGFDTYLHLVNRNTGEVLDYNDDSNQTLNSQLNFTVEEGIEYILRTTSYSESTQGDYTLLSNIGSFLAVPAIDDNNNPPVPPSPGSNLSVIQGTQTLNGSLEITDSLNPTHSSSYSDDYQLTGVSAGQLVQVSLNSSDFNSYLQLINADTGQELLFNDDFNNTPNSQLSFTVAEGINYTIRATSFDSNVTGSYTLTTSTTDPTSPIPSPTPTGNQTFNGSLDTTDSTNTEGSYTDDYELTGVNAGQVLQVNLNSSDFDPYLQLINAGTGEVLLFNDDISFDDTNSQFTFTVQSDINYILRVTSYTPGETGSYTLSTTTIPIPEGFNSTYGYGVVDAAAAVASAIEQATGQAVAFPDSTDYGGDYWGLDMVNAQEVWNQGYTGQGVIVAVIDNGVDYTHTDLAANIWVNSDEIAGDGLDNDANGYIDDVRGWDFVDTDNDPMLVVDDNLDTTDDHGTHVAGIIAAENNGVGSTGVAPDAQIMPVRVIGTAEQTPEQYYQALANGIRYAADNGARIINLSLRTIYGEDVSSVREAIQYAAEERGSIVVMSAGNTLADSGEDSSQPIYPARYATDWGIAVGAVDSNRAMPDITEDGWESNRAGIIPLDYVVAPGVNVYSTTQNNGYAYYSGTSMAAPSVAGVVALMLSANPNLTQTQVESILTETANPTGINQVAAPLNLA